MSADRLSIRARTSFPGFEFDITAELNLNGVTVVFGPSGGGKSTLLRAIAGFETPSAGRIAMGETVWLDSDARVNVPAWRRPVGFTFQDVRLFAHLSVAGNLAFADKRSRARNAAYSLGDVVAALALEPLLHRRIGALSGGERQRVALARTLLSRPRLLLLDEPLSALDHARKIAILPYLEAAPKQFGVPAIYVSHDIEEVAQLADDILVLSQGRVEAHGPAVQIIEQLDLQPPIGRFETGALVQGRVIAHDARLHMARIAIGDDTISLPTSRPLSAGAIVRLRIRARDVAIATQRPEGLSIRNIFAGTVGGIAPSPDTAFAEVAIDLGAARIRAKVTKAAVEDLGLSIGMQVYALIKSVSFDRSLR